MHATGSTGQLRKPLRGRPVLNYYQCRGRVDCLHVACVHAYIKPPGTFTRSAVSKRSPSTFLLHVSSRYCCVVENDIMIDRFTKH